MFSIAALPPTCFNISFCAPTKSPSNASCLALSKLMFLPNIAPSSNSLFNEFSISNRLSAIPVNELISTPILAAAAAASIMFLPPSLPKSANASVLLANIPATFAGITPCCFANSFVVAIISAAISAEPPFNLANEPIRPAACSELRFKL